MTIEEILAELDIETAPEHHHHSTSKYISIDCPFCGKGTQGFHLGIHKSGSHGSCWRCGPHSTVDILTEITQQPRFKIHELLKDIQTEFFEPVRTQGTLKLPKGIKTLKDLPRHQKYLKERGYNWKKLSKLWNIQGIGIAANLSWRIFIPIQLNGEIVSWTTRTISKNKDITRYISASPEQEKINHKTLLYGEDYARHAVVIVEGPFDVMRIGPGAVATLGTGFSTAQVNRLTQFPVRAVIFDTEKEAQKRAKKLMDALIDFPGETFRIELESGKDAGEASEKEIQQIRKEILT